MADIDFFTRKEQEEFARRMDTEFGRIEDEDKRQNKRIDALEETVKEISKLSLSIERMTASIQTMTAEITRQGERIEGLEEKPGKRWETLISGIIGAIAGAIGAAIVAGVIR